MSANQPTSFRYPFSLEEEKAHPNVIAAIRYAFSGLKDLNDANRALNTKVNSLTPAATTQSAVTTVVASGGGTSPVLGTVNLQPNLTPGAYSTQSADFGGLILVQSSVPFALTLDSGLTVPYFTTVYNLGAGTIIATPSTGMVNNVASLNLATDQFAIIFWDGANWWAVIQQAVPILSGTSASLGGSPMTAGQTISITVPVTGATTSMAVIVSPQTYPGDSFVWDGYVSAADTVTVRLTAVLALTPAASLYNVRVVE